MEACFKRGDERDVGHAGSHLPHGRYVHRIVRRGDVGHFVHRGEDLVIDALHA